MSKINAYCTICGRGYHKCLACRDYAVLHPWQMYTDSSEHYKIFQILHGYNTGVFTKDEARARFQNIDLTDLETFRPDIKSAVKAIINDEDKAGKRVIRKKRVSTDNNTSVKE